ncbi:hypothetical protein GCM10010430_36450 [Kitasatospora cystarginea]|uniref:Hydrogenase maturation protease n=2 Tax=Streptomycetaceae TaxID=2062 RepID=A0ABP5R370_9ACTN
MPEMPGESAEDRIVLIGVGDEYRHDDGAAVAVLAELAADRLPADRIALSDGEPSRLIELWEGAGLAVVVDAVHSHPAEPGRLHQVRVSPDDPGGAMAESHAADSHGLGLGEAVGLAAVLGRLPRELLIVAVEGADFTEGEGLSQDVAAAVPRAADLVRQAVAEHLAWRDGPA